MEEWIKRKFVAEAEQEAKVRGGEGERRRRREEEEKEVDEVEKERVGEVKGEEKRRGENKIAKKIKHSSLKSLICMELT